MAQMVKYGSRAGRWVLLATILASGIAQLDATVVNVALPRIGRNLHVGLTSLQWTVNAYALTLSGLLLLGGSLGDRFGRRRIFVLGVIWFTAASLGCALAPSGAVLIAMRAVQGVGGAMLTPGSLAILQAVFEPEDRAPAVGAWSGLTGVASALGPIVGGLLVAVAPWGWRLVFLINLPLAAAVVFASRHIPETRDESAEGRIDVRRRGPGSDRVGRGDLRAHGGLDVRLGGPTTRCHGRRGGPVDASSPSSNSASGRRCCRCGCFARNSSAQPTR